AFGCFSFICSPGTDDVIEFIRLKEKSTKHEAVLKAKALLGYTPPKPAASEDLPHVAVMAKDLESCRKSIAGSERARVYATSRGLDWQRRKLGFSGVRRADRWSKSYKENESDIGLLM